MKYISVSCAGSCIINKCMPQIVVWIRPWETPIPHLPTTPNSTMQPGKVSLIIHTPESPIVKIDGPGGQNVSNSDQIVTRVRTTWHKHPGISIVISHRKVPNVIGPPCFNEMFMYTDHVGFSKPVCDIVQRYHVRSSRQRRRHLQVHGQNIVCMLK